MNVPLLEMLRARRGRWIRAQDLGEHLLLPVDKLRAGIRELDGAGYLIEQRRGQYRFAGVSDRLIPHEIMRSLGTSIVGRNVVCLDTTSSTNDEVWERFQQGAREGTTVFAEVQGRGRGRFGRRWACPPRAGILMSALLCPNLEPARSSVLTVMGAVAVADVLNERFRVPALIRWPNDVIANGGKIGGILVESRKDTRRGTAFVLGIGLNVNMTPEQMPREIRATATSLLMLTGQTQHRIDIARALLRALDRWYSEVLDARYEVISQHWRQYSSSLGERIIVEQDGRRYTGRVLDLSIEEGLILRLDRGGTRIFDGARVSVISGKET